MKKKLPMALAFRISIISTLDVCAYTPSVIQAFETLSEQSLTFVTLWTIMRFIMAISFVAHFFRSRVYGTLSFISSQLVMDCTIMS